MAPAVQLAMVMRKVVENRPSVEPAHVVIAGGGFAAVEAGLALRAVAGDRVQLTMISPEPTLRYRPAATLAAFEEGPPLSYDLRAVASDFHSLVSRPKFRLGGGTSLRTGRFGRGL